MQSNQRSIRATYMRGGTSKGVFLHARDLPPAGPDRDAVLLRIMGSPDPLQIDGMGGTYSSTSKVIVVGAPRDGVLPYWFGQVEIDEPQIDWHGNCGNLTTAVGPFTIEEGLMPADEPITNIKLLNANTDTVIQAAVPIADGTFRVYGDHTVDGVPGTGSPVTTTYLDPAGKTTGNVLPLGAVTEVDLPDGTSVRACVVDASSVYAFIHAAELGVDLHAIDVATLNGNEELLKRIEHIRSRLAGMLGRVNNPADAAESSATIPRVMLISPGDDAVHVHVRAVMMGAFHRALPMTGALCTAAAAHLPDTLVSQCLDDAGSCSEVVIGHPKGQAVVHVATEGLGAQRKIRSLSVTRTARRIMDGYVYV